MSLSWKKWVFIVLVMMVVSVIGGTLVQLGILPTRPKRGTTTDPFTDLFKERKQKKLEKERLEYIDFGIQYASEIISDKDTWLNISRISRSYSLLSKAYIDDNKFEEISRCILKLEDIRKIIKSELQQKMKESVRDKNEGTQYRSQIIASISKHGWYNVNTSYASCGSLFVDCDKNETISLVISSGSSPQSEAIESGLYDYLRGFGFTYISVQRGKYRDVFEWDFRKNKKSSQITGTEYDEVIQKLGLDQPFKIPTITAPDK